MIKFSPSEENEINEFISDLSSFGKVYEENKDIQIEQKINGEKFIDIGIKSSKEQLNGLSIKFYPFSKEEYNNFYPNDVIYEEDEGVFTLHLDVKNEFINKVFDNKDKYENELKKIVENFNIFSSPEFSLRKINNKLFLDLKEKDEDYESKESKIFFLIFTLFCNHLKILMNFKNNLTFENLMEMDLKEFYNYFSIFDFSFFINGKFKKF